MNSIISARGLGKRYQIGANRDAYGSLRDSIVAGVRVPLDRLRGIKPESSSVWALKDISFEVAQGDVVGLIGRNGAGKSTLLKLLARITSPSTGCAEINGRVASLLEVGTGFHPELTGRENIFLNGAILGMKKTEITRKFDEIVAFSEVEKYLDTPVKRYSSGMFMRLAFAVAAHLEPEILLVDEVLAVGDLAFQKKCMGKMGEVARNGRTIFFVSHNLGSISTLCNKAIYLAGGTVKQMGPVDEVVQRFVGEMMENRIDDINLLRKPGTGVEMRFTEVGLALDGKREESEGERTSLLFGEPITYALTVESDVDADDLSIAITILDAASVCIGTLFVRETFSLRAGERRKLQVRIEDIDLAPGQYFSALSIGQGSAEVVRHDFDVIVGKPAFEIAAAGLNTGSLAHWQQSYMGHVVFRKHQMEFVG